MTEMRVGLKGKLYYGAAGAQATTEITAVEDVTVVLDKDMVEATPRGCGGWKTNKGVLRTLQLEFTLVDMKGDAATAFLRQAWFNDEPVALYAKDAADGEGPDGDFEIGPFRRREPAADKIVYEITANLNTDLRNPIWSS